MVELVVTVGPPASAKSTWAQKIAERENYAWVSSDNIRANYGYDISNTDVFNEMFDITVANLKEGISVIYDATNLSSKRRRNLITAINCLHIDDIVMFRCEVFVAPIDELKRRNRLREGVACVPEEVIDRMIKQFQFPQYFEGWDFININSNSVGESFDLYTMKGYNQNNPHHSLDLYEHSRAVVENSRKLNLPFTIGEAGWYHDIGKPLCRTEGKDGFAHYNNHDCVSAYLFALYQANNHEYDNDTFLEIIFLINYHMRPHNWTQKSYDKDKQVFGEHYIHQLKLFHKCDLEAH